jgi:hypothetical protein
MDGRDIGLILSIQVLTKTSKIRINFVLQSFLVPIPGGLTC